MALIEEVKNVCNRLAPHGWKELFAAHGLDITKDDLATELSRKLENTDNGKTTINRNLKGFEDFSLDGMRGITPKNPAQSLLFHAFASPNVTHQNTNKELNEFPTLKEMETIENYVYGVEPLSQNFIDNANPGELAIVVFASEYRLGPDTPHKKYADICFSRTGISRIGTSGPTYDSKRRGFISVVKGNPHEIRVLPCKYSAYIAIREPGDKQKFRPMNFKEVDRLDGKSDDERIFWIPIHKLFDGDECIQGLNLHVQMKCEHVNEKIKRIHMFLNDRRVPQEHSGSKLDEPDFKFTAGIAEFSSNSDFGTNLLVPVVHPSLISPAKHNGKNLTFKVPPRDTQRGINTLSSSLELRTGTIDRSVPEYVHVRHEIVPGQNDPINLNDQDNIDLIRRIRQGGYVAQHYVDFSGDGWIKVTCDELKNKISETKSAYSLVTAPDFFPNVNQREVMEWEKIGSGQRFQGQIWVQGGPDPLSQTRLPANVETFQNEFSITDKTMTAIVSPQIDGTNNAQSVNSKTIAKADRHSFLPDNAAGIFAPGWDVSRAVKNGEVHLAAYGLGSPFPEDAKLCAALSTFWPSASPDTGRTFGENPTVSPMTDEELGSGGMPPWDGIERPKKIDGTDLVEYTRFPYADYVDSALNNLFSLAQTSSISSDEYNSRIMYMTRIYDALGFMTRKEELIVLSFQRVSSDDNELKDALTSTNTSNDLEKPIFRFVVFTEKGNPTISQTDHKKQRTAIDDLWIIFASKNLLLIKKNNTSWAKTNA